MREMGRSVFWCVCVSPCAVTQITEMDYLVLWVQVIKTKNLLFCQGVRKKRKKNACILQVLIIYLWVVLQTSVYYHVWWVNLTAKSIILCCGINVRFLAPFLALSPHSGFKTGAQMHLQHIMHMHHQKHWFAVNNSCHLGHLVLIMRSQGLGSFQMMYEIFAVSHSHWQLLSC